MNYYPTLYNNDPFSRIISDLLTDIPDGGEEILLVINISINNNFFK